MRIGLMLAAMTVLFTLGCAPAAATPDGGPTITSGIALSGCNGIGYSAPVQIGGQTFSLFLDTGASTIAVATAGCTGCTGVTPTFTPDSMTMSTGKTAMVSYSNDTGWSGPTATDAVSLATVPAVQTTFAEITTAKGFFQDLDCAGDMVTTSPIQGTLGLGPPDLVVSDTQDYLTQLAGARALGNSFAVQFCPAGGGHLWFGGFDIAATTAAPQYAPMTASKYWSVAVQGVTMGGIPLQSLGDSLVDTGTSVNVFPTSVVTAIQAQLQIDTAFATVFGSTAFGEIFGQSPTCASTVNGLTIQQVNTQLPPLTFTFASSGGGTFSLTVPATGAYLRVTTAGGVQYYCNGMMDAAQAGLPSGLTGLLGEVFLNAFVTIFDVQNKQLGFAPLTGCD